MFERLMLWLGWVPATELEGARINAEREKKCRAEREAELAIVRARAEKLRVDTRELFRHGVDLGRTQCPSAISFVGGRVVAKRTCHCTPTQPQCAYNICARGLQITEHIFT